MLAFSKLNPKVGLVLVEILSRGFSWLLNLAIFGSTCLCVLHHGVDRLKGVKFITVLTFFTCGAPKEFDG